MATAAGDTPCCTTYDDGTLEDCAGWFKLAAEGACSEDDAAEERDAIAGPSEFTDRVAEAVYRTVLQALPWNILLLQSRTLVLYASPAQSYSACTEVTPHHSRTCKPLL